MALPDGIIGPVAGIIDKLIPDHRARDATRIALIKRQRSQELETLKTQMAAIVAEAQSRDRWTSRARPGFLYVMYALLLWSIPMGLIAALRPATANAIARGMTAYLGGIPEPHYALFGTGYLGYTVVRSWGKAKGVEK